MGIIHSTTTATPTSSSHVAKRQLPTVRMPSSLFAIASSKSPYGDTHAKLVEKASVDIDAHPILDISPLAIVAEHDVGDAYFSFIKQYPGYRLTWIIDTLRQSDFTRLKRREETYVDYMGGSIYPESLVRLHSSFLQHQVMGNTHSISTSSALSSREAKEARAAVLSFFRAPPDYTVVFTANASAALKLVGESYPFTEGSSFILGEDSHNSVHGIRRFADQCGAGVSYIPTTQHGGLDELTALGFLSRNRPQTPSTSSLFALTGQSNITNSKTSLSLVAHAQALGYHVLLDAAALAPTSLVSLAETPVDAMAISFYKMFGYPTGVGALIVKKSFLAQLRRPWFAGGTVDVVQVPGDTHTMSSYVHEQFEDGTINYLSLPAITDGLRFLSAYLPFLPLRLSSLLHYLCKELSSLKHPSGAPVVSILSRQPSQKLTHVGEQSDVGSIISLLFLSPDGTPIPNSLVEQVATAHRISLRTGCMCNPGGAAALLGLRELMAGPAGAPDITLSQLEAHAGRELGVVRVSLGLATNWADVHKLVQFAQKFANDQQVRGMKARWTASREL